MQSLDNTNNIFSSFNSNSSEVTSLTGASSSSLSNQSQPALTKTATHAINLDSSNSPVPTTHSFTVTKTDGKKPISHTQYCNQTKTQATPKLQNPALQKYFFESSTEERIIKYMQLISLAKEHTHPVEAYLELKKTLTKIKADLQAPNLSLKNSKLIKEKEKHFQAQFDNLRNYLASEKARNEISSFRIWSKATPPNPEMQRKLQEVKNITSAYLHKCKFYSELTIEELENINMQVATAIELGTSVTFPASTISTAAASSGGEQSTTPTLSIDARQKAELAWDDL